jgi:hypothetical protein
MLLKIKMEQLASITLAPSGFLNLSNTSQNTSSVGNVWYDNSDNRIKYSYYVGLWSAGGALITVRRLLAGTGTQTAGLAFGGDSPAGILSCTEEYIGFNIQTL